MFLPHISSILPHSYIWLNVCSVETHVWPHVRHMRKMKVPSNGLIRKDLRNKWRVDAKHFENITFLNPMSHGIYEYNFLRQISSFQIWSKQAILSDLKFSPMACMSATIAFPITDEDMQYRCWIKYTTELRIYGIIVYRRQSNIFSIEIYGVSDGTICNLRWTSDGHTHVLIYGMKMILFR